MRRFLLAALLMGTALPAFAGNDPCAPGTPWAAGVTLTAAELIDCTWSGETFVADGATADANTNTLAFEDPTAAFTTQFQDAGTTGTFNVALLELAQTWTGVQSFTTPNLLGKVDLNNTAVDDDDCTGDQGKMWYDTTDLAWEVCNANTGVPATVAATSGDVTAVGNCTTGACFVTGGSGTAIESDSDLVLALDANNNGTNTLSITDGADASVVEITEAGVVSATSFVADPSATPNVGFQDSGMGGTPDINAQILVNCPTGTTAGGDEDCDMDFQVQAAGTLATVFRIDTTDGGASTIDVVKPLSFSGSGDLDLPNNSVDDADMNTTAEECFTQYTPGSTIAATYDVQSVWRAPVALTITEVWCETDTGTVDLDLQIDDGTPADIMGTDLVCASTAVSDNSGLTGSMAVGDRIDFAITSVASSPTRLTACIVYTL